MKGNFQYIIFQKTFLSVISPIPFCISPHYRCINSKYNKTRPTSSCPHGPTKVQEPNLAAVARRHRGTANPGCATDDLEEVGSFVFPKLTFQNSLFYFVFSFSMLFIYNFCMPNAFGGHLKFVHSSLIKGLSCSYEIRLKHPWTHGPWSHQGYGTQSTKLRDDLHQGSFPFKRKLIQPLSGPSPESF